MKDISIKDLKEIFDDQILSDLTDHFAGCRLVIPKKKSVIQFGSVKDRNRYIWNMYFENGSSYEEISQKVELHPDSIKRILLEMVKEELHK